MKISLVLLIPCLSLWAAQDATITNAFTLANASVPAQSGHCTLEFVIDNQPASPTVGGWFPSGSNPCGMNLQWISGPTQLQLYWVLGTGGTVSQIHFGTTLRVVRFQVDPATKTTTADAWDQSCTSVFSETQAYTGSSGSNSNGVDLKATDSTGFRLSWFRLSTDTFAPATGCPTTAATERTFFAHWKFEGNLNDSSGSGYTLTGGTPSYNTTPSAFANLVVSSVCPVSCASQPAYSALLPSGQSVSVRAGQPVTLEGSGFSQADAASTVTYFWQMLSSPSPPIWSSHTASTVTLSGLTFGDYNWQLQATDTAGNVATSNGHIGAVATDSNGVVVTGNSDIDFLLGPMIAFGKNPWGYQDYWSAHASALRAIDYAAPRVDQGQNYPGWSTLQKPQWELPGQGIVSYYFNCTGLSSACNGVGTTLNGSITATATNIVVNDATKLDLSSFPTHIIVYDGTNNDELRVTSASSNTLTLAYDPSALPRHSFGNGVNVLQAKVTGSGTKFLTDSTAPVCPVGAGPPGVSVYSTGTITLTANSATVTGSGATFTSGMVGDFIRVAATHSSTAFIFVAQISAYNSSTSLTLARVYPSTADTTAGLVYDVMPATRTAVLQYGSLYTDPTYAPSAKAQIMFGTSGCESETDFYTNPFFAGLGNSFSIGHDIPALDGSHQTSQKYSVTDTTSWVNQGATGGINFYGEGIAHRALYLRSGLASAYTAAAVIDNYWIHSPWGNADGNGYPRLFLGGGGIGAFISKITDADSLVSWADLRGYANLGKAMVDGIAASGCNAYDDTRDSGYAYSWLILAAIYDPDTTSTAAPGGIPWRTYWQNQIAQVQTNDTNCQRADHSFSNGFYWNGNLPALTLTNGSAAATGVSLPSSMCNGTASGTATVTNGANSLSVLTGSIPGGTTALFLTGTTGSGSTVFVQSLAYGGGVLGGLWKGDSGTVNWISGTFDGYPGNGNASDMMTIATSNDDLANLKKSWACTWNSSTSITLNRAWDGSNGSTYHAYNGNLAGYGQQPFMLGIKSYGMNLLATQTVAALSSFVSPYATFTANSTSWIWNNGMDPDLLGTNYGRIFQQCEPANTAPGGTTFTFRAPGCTYGNDPAGVFLSREQNAETSAAHGIYYQNNTSAPNKTLGDKWYGALWCSSAWTTGGGYCDSNSTANNAAQSNLDDSNIHAGKWFGFFTGIGMSGRWPAVRLGGSQPSIPRNIFIGFSLSSFPAAAKVTATIFYPSGFTASATCATSPCQVTADARQGSPLFQLQYLTSGNAAIATSDKILLVLN